ncbi:hypothetical protein K438DRAFT_1874881 [Mycena galopus ATCC 62051]|nr:hypothetical protein K438DRAFT_1874881 [Mycena galopus ATCC 62051]
MSLAKDSTPSAGRSPRAATAAAASTTWLTRQPAPTTPYPHFRALLTCGTRLAYSAHALTDGRLQSSPRLDFQDGAVVGWMILTSIPSQWGSVAYSGSSYFSGLPGR